MLEGCQDAGRAASGRTTPGRTPQATWQAPGTWRHPGYKRAEQTCRVIRHLYLSKDEVHKSCAHPRGGWRTSSVTRVQFMVHSSGIHAPVASQKGAMPPLLSSMGRLARPKSVPEVPREITQVPSFTAPAPSALIWLSPLPPHTTHALSTRQEALKAPARAVQRCRACSATSPEDTGPSRWPTCTRSWRDLHHAQQLGLGGCWLAVSVSA